MNRPTIHPILCVWITGCLGTCFASSPVALGGGQDLVLVRGGTYLMGDVFEDERKFMIDERPLHEVKLDDFYISKCETTVGDFRAFVRASAYQTLKEKDLEAQRERNETPYDTYTWKKSGFKQEDNHPVVWVAWEDAAAYCNWLSKREGYPVAYDLETYEVIDAHGNPTDSILEVKGYRLPTEAEWEYAAREGGRSVLYGNGKNTAREGEISCLFCDISLSTEERESLPAATTPVGSFRPNALGLYDMSGNAWEWCLDQGCEYTADKQANPYYQGAAHMIRGGTYGSEPFSCNVFARINFWPKARCGASGFRIARTARWMNSSSNKTE